MKRSILFLLVVLCAGAPVIKAMEKAQSYQSDSSSSDSSDSSSDEREDAPQTRTNIYNSNGAGTHADEDYDLKRIVLYSDDSSDPDDIQGVVSGSTQGKSTAGELDQDVDYADDEGNDEDGAHWSDGEDLGYSDDEQEEEADRKGNYFDLEKDKKKLKQSYFILHKVLPQLLVQAKALGIPVKQFQDITGGGFKNIDSEKVTQFFKKCHRKLEKKYGNKIFFPSEEEAKQGQTRANIDVQEIVENTEKIIDKFIGVYTQIKFAKKGQKRSMVTEANVQILANFSLVLLDVFKKGLEVKMNDTTLTDEERGIFKRWYNKILAVGVVVATGLGVGSMMGWCNIAGYIPFLQAYLPEAMMCAVTS